MSRLVKLQINQRGAWRDLLRIDADQIVDQSQFLAGAESMVCNSGAARGTTMRIVTDESVPNRLMAWDVATGWMTV